MKPKSQSTKAKAEQQDSTPASASPALEGQFIVEVPFRFEEGETYHKGDDVSSFDPEKLESLLSRGLVIKI